MFPIRKAAKAADLGLARKRVGQNLVRLALVPPTRGGPENVRSIADQPLRHLNANVVAVELERSYLETGRDLDDVVGRELKDVVGLSPAQFDRLVSAP